MKIASRAMRIALAGGLVAGAFAVSGATPQAESAEPEAVGACTGMNGLAAFKSTTINPLTGKGYGLTDKDDQDIAIGTKGLGVDGVGTNLGTCVIGAGPGAGLLTIAKWGAKLSSPEADCVTTVDDGSGSVLEDDESEWSIAGKLDVAFDNLAKMSTFVRAYGFTDGDPGTPEQDVSDVVDLRGLVTKGTSVGAVVESTVFFDPLTKSKIDPTTYGVDGLPGTLDDVAGTGVQHFPGYWIDVAAAFGCTDDGPGDNGFFNANIVYAAIGDGPSLILGLPAEGITIKN